MHTFFEKDTCKMVQGVTVLMKVLMFEIALVDILPDVSYAD